MHIEAIFNVQPAEQAPQVISAINLLREHNFVNLEGHALRVWWPNFGHDLKGISSQFPNVAIACDAFEDGLHNIKQYVFFNGKITWAAEVLLPPVPWPNMILF